jgi:erythromycin esterase
VKAESVRLIAQVNVKRLALAILVTLPVALLAQSDTATWVVWTRQNHFPFASLVATPNDDYSDLQFLKPVIGSRRLVQLGESGHGVAEFDAAKVRLIKFFHEQMGFDVMAFESSIYECFAAGTATSSVDMLAGSIFTVWATEEVVPLFEYILTTQRTERPLILAGFDTQISSARGLAQRPAFFRRIVAAVDVDYADEVAAFDTDFVLRSRSDPSKYDASEAFYDGLDTFFKDNRDRLAQAFPSDPSPIIAERTAYSMVQFIRQLRAFAARPTDTGAEGGGAIRDAGMAENLTALAREIYPDRKILIWAHNFHIRHANASTASVQRTMGSFIVERFRPELYTIGLYMNQGLAAFNDRSIYAIRPAPNGSMEWVMASAGPSALFVDLLHQSPEPGNEWMFQPVETREWGVSSLQLVPRDQYDGVLFIDRVTPPRYLRF